MAFFLIQDLLAARPMHLSLSKSLYFWEMEPRKQILESHFCSRRKYNWDVTP